MVPKKLKINKHTNQSGESVKNCCCTNVSFLCNPTASITLIFIEKKMQHALKITVG